MRKIYFFFALLIGLVSCSEQKSEVAQLLQNKITEVGANYGEVTVMETATGNIIEKICLDKEGKPYEDNFNDEDRIVIYAPTYLALLDSSINPTDTFDVGNGIYVVDGDTIKDHNWERGGYGKLTLEDAFCRNSKVTFAMATKDSLNNYLEGNNIQSILIFYNKIAQDTTTENVQLLKKAMRRNVTDELGKMANSEKVEIAAHGRTFQIEDDTYRMEFCGFFPFNSPKYTLMVVMGKDNYPVSDASMCGTLFKDIAECLMKQ